jgi:hypothetical protein
VTWRRKPKKRERPRILRGLTNHPLNEGSDGTLFGPLVGWVSLPHHSKREVAGMYIGLGTLLVIIILILLLN